MDRKILERLNAFVVMSLISSRFLPFFNAFAASRTPNPNGSETVAESIISILQLEI